MTGVILGNWKMHGDARMLDQFAAMQVPSSPHIVCGLAVPAILLERAIAGLRAQGWQLGGQDVSMHQQGAYTGCTSAAMLAELDTNFCLVGHSERRIYQHETNEQVAAKIGRLNEQHITPVVCVGENLAQREAGQTTDIVHEQLAACIEQLQQARHAMVAYEPVWAIGTGKTASVAQAQEVHAAIKEQLAAAGLKTLQVLYGGSVNADTIAPLLVSRDIDGALVGGASLKTQSWQDMLEQLSKI